MAILVNFARGGNAECFALSGWSEQEDAFVWTIGARSSIALPCLDSEADLEVEADVTGFDSSKTIPLRLKLGGHIVADFRITGREIIRFRIPPRGSSQPDASLELEHPVFRDPTPNSGECRPLAFCFRQMSFRYAGINLPRVARCSARTILIIGDSHIGALRQAFDRTDGSLGTRTIAADFVGLAPGHFWARPISPNHRYDPRIIEEIGQRAIERRVTAIFSTIFGNGHLILGGTQHPEPFDFFVPGAGSAALSHDREIVPYALIRRKARKGTKTLLGFLAALGRRISVPTYHIASPPPAATNERLSLYLCRVAAAGGNDWLLSTVIEPPSFRYKVWRVYEDVAREVVESEGGTYLPPPESALDSSGFLIKSMEHDGFHANALYGEAVLTQINKALLGPTG